jgi:type VI secretion system secreted protein Hcp
MAFDAFLKIDTIDGDSQDKSHPKEIQIDSFSFGVTQFTSVGSATGGAGAGKASLQDIHFSSPMNVASPKLFQACVSGQHFQKVVLSCRKAGGEQTSSDFLKITLTDVLISGYATGSNELDNGFSARPGDSDVPTDQFSINFHKISMLFTSPGVTNPDGTTANLGVTGAADISVQ